MSEFWTKEHISFFQENIIFVAKQLQLFFEKYNIYQPGTQLQVIQDLLQETKKLEALEVYIAVCGPMKSGKSTFVNSLTGLDLAPHRTTAMTLLPTIYKNTRRENPLLFISDTLYEACKKIHQAIRLETNKEKVLVGDKKYLVDFNLFEKCEWKNNERIYEDGIKEVLMFISDLFRVAPDYDVEISLEVSTFKLSDMPRVEVPFKILSDVSNSLNFNIGLSIVDLPGINEGGRITSLLEDIFNNVLKKTSAIIHIINKENMNSVSDDHIRNIILEHAVINGIKIYSFLNKFDNPNDDFDLLKDTAYSYYEKSLEKIISSTNEMVSKDKFFKIFQKDQIFPLSAIKCFLYQKYSKGAPKIPDSIFIICQEKKFKLKEIEIYSSGISNQDVSLFHDINSLNRIVNGEGSLEEYKPDDETFQILYNKRMKCLLDNSFIIDSLQKVLYDIIKNICSTLFESPLLKFRNYFNSLNKEIKNQDLLLNCDIKSIKELLSFLLEEKRLLEPEVIKFKIESNEKFEKMKLKVKEHFLKKREDVLYKIENDYKTFWNSIKYVFSKHDKLYEIFTSNGEYNFNTREEYDQFNTQTQKELSIWFGSLINEFTKDLNGIINSYCKDVEDQYKQNISYHIDRVEKKMVKEGLESQIGHIFDIDLSSEFTNEIKSLIILQQKEKVFKKWLFFEENTIVIFSIKFDNIRKDILSRLKNLFDYHENHVNEIFELKIFNQIQSKIHHSEEYLKRKIYQIEQAIKELKEEVTKKSRKNYLNYLKDLLSNLTRLSKQIYSSIENRQVKNIEIKELIQKIELCQKKESEFKIPIDETLIRNIEEVKDFEQVEKPKKIIKK